MAWVTKDSVEQYDHTPEPPREYTKKEKAQNWWHYHKFIVLGVVVAILVVAWFIKDTVFQTRPDVQIGYIGQYDLPADTVTAPRHPGRRGATSPGLRPGWCGWCRRRSW